MEKFAVGLIIGGIGGALLTANNYKMRTLVRKTQEEVQANFDRILDEKIRAMDIVAEEVREKTEETVDKIGDSLSKKSAKSKKANA